MSFDLDLQARSAEIREQARRIETCPDPTTRMAALQLLRSVMDLHQSALERMLAIIAENCAEPTTIIESFAQDPLIHSVLTLHDLHPHDLETRIARALAQLQPKLQRHKVEAKVISIADGAVRIFLEASSQHSSISATLKSSVEQVLMDAAPDAQITVETATDLKSSFVPLDALRSADNGRNLNGDVPVAPAAHASTSVQDQVVNAVPQGTGVSEK
jgi:Fe-S cluster biogenesis protein NfuA